VTIPLPPVAVGLWLIVATGALVRLSRQLWQLKRLRSMTTVLDEDEWTSILADATRRVHVRSTVTLRTGGTATTPFTWGLRLPQVLLPTSAAAWPREQAELVLAHELAHVRRHDWAWLVAMAFVRAVYVWHPLMWLAVGAARAQAEHACDDLVLRHGTKPSRYAQVLIDLAAAASSQPSPVVTAMTSKTSLERRIEVMLDESITHTPGRGLARWLAASAVIAATVVVAGAAAQARGDGTGMVTGTVRPADGHPLAGVEIVFTGATQVAVRTDAAGAFAATLPAGVYRSHIKVPGFRASEALLDVADGDRVARDFTLALAELTETIHVSGPSDQPGEPIDLSPNLKLPTSVGVITLPRRVHHKVPEYPAHLREAGVEGTVKLSARVDPDGHVNDFKVAQSPHDGLTQAVIDAVGRWRYAPTRVQGTPVSTDIVVTVDYRAK
jgi:TonB family protein